MKKRIYILLFILPSQLFSQGLNHTWLLGYDYTLTSDKARINFTLNSDTLITEQRKIPFRGDTQANISNNNGDLLLASNGVWIANATGDTMMNGSGLNPSPFTSSWPHGLQLSYGHMFLTWPGDTNKIILFHQTAHSNTFLESTELYYSIVDLTLDSGLGGVSQKNQIIFQDTLSWGISACKHANGRDWWIVALKDLSNIVYKLLLTPNGISSITTQILNVPFQYANAGQPTFSPDGTKFAYTYGYAGSNPYHDVRLFHFDRCTGVFSDTTFIPIFDTSTGFGLAFGPNSKYLYVSSFKTIYQINTDTSDIVSSLNAVAINDTFASPFPPFYTDFYLMYLAANGKIYITSGNTVLDLHFINYPDSSGFSCDVHQHGLHIPCFHGRAVPNHPNYYLGPVIGSTCDSLPHVGINENEFDFHFSISPNPTNGSIKIIYLMPQNKCGVFTLYDILGKKVYSLRLPPWSSLQHISLPNLINGIYSAVITSNRERVSKKLVIMRE